MKSFVISGQNGSILVLSWVLHGEKEWSHLFYLFAYQ